MGITPAGGIPKRVGDDSHPTLEQRKRGRDPPHSFFMGSRNLLLPYQDARIRSGIQDPERAVHRWHSLAVVSQAVGRPAPPALVCACLGWSVVGRLAALRRRPPGLPFPAARRCGCCSWPGRLICARASARRRALPCASRRPRLYCMGGAVRGRLDLLGVSPLCGSPLPGVLRRVLRLRALALRLVTTRLRPPGTASPLLSHSSP